MQNSTIFTRYPSSSTNAFAKEWHAVFNEKKIISLNQLLVHNAHCPHSHWINLKLHYSSTLFPLSVQHYIYLKCVFATLGMLHTWIIIDEKALVLFSFWNSKSCLETIFKETTRNYYSIIMKTLPTILLCFIRPNNTFTSNIQKKSTRHAFAYVPKTKVKPNTEQNKLAASFLYSTTKISEQNYNFIFLNMTYM